MTKYFQLDWKRPVPDALQLGTTCDRWSEVSFVIRLGCFLMLLTSFSLSLTQPNLTNMAVAKAVFVKRAIVEIAEPNLSVSNLT
jgi:hypothetical protein